MKYKRKHFIELRAAASIGRRDYNHGSYKNSYHNPSLKAAYDLGFNWDRAKAMPLFNIFKRGIYEYIKAGSYKAFKVRETRILSSI